MSSSHLRHDLRHRQGVGDIGGAVLAQLAAVVRCLGVLEGGTDAGSRSARDLIVASGLVLLQMGFIALFYSCHQSYCLRSLHVPQMSGAAVPDTALSSRSTLPPGCRRDVQVVPVVRSRRISPRSAKTSRHTMVRRTVSAPPGGRGQIAAGQTAARWLSSGRLRPHGASGSATGRQTAPGWAAGRAASCGRERSPPGGTAPQARRSRSRRWARVRAGRRSHQLQLDAAPAPELVDLESRRPRPPGRPAATPQLLRRWRRRRWRQRSVPLRQPQLQMPVLRPRSAWLSTLAADQGRTPGGWVAGAVGLQPAQLLHLLQGQQAPGRQISRPSPGRRPAAGRRRYCADTAVHPLAERRGYSPPGW